MGLGKILIGFGMTFILAVGSNLFGTRQAAAQSSRPYVVFVNGDRNCCSWAMKSLQTRLVDKMNAEPRYVPYNNFRDGDKSNSTDNDSAFLREGADFIDNRLDRNRPLILIGHSFGGASVLRLLPHINRQIQFVAVIDPFSTGGLRPALASVPSNVDYFFNRWQENEVFSNEYARGGAVRCSAKKCDQQEQEFSRSEDGRIVNVKCDFRRACNLKQKVTDRQSLATDDWMQRTIGDRISEVLARNVR